jgi:hypothetical protein
VAVSGSDGTKTSLTQQYRSERITSAVTKMTPTMAAIASQSARIGFGIIGDGERRSGLPFLWPQLVQYKLEPGKPNVALVPRGPTVYHRPRRPMLVETPLFATFK